MTERRIGFAQAMRAIADGGLHAAVRDVLSHRDHGARVLVVANLPYSAGTPALFRLLLHHPPPDQILAMLQSEVVDRLRAAPGTRDYGPAAILAERCIKEVSIVEYEELGMEAIWRIEVEDFPAFVIVDDKGNDFFKQL